MSAEPAEQTIEDAAPSSGKKKIITLGVVGGIMLLEGVGIFMLARMTGEPAPSEAGEAMVDPLQLIEQMDVEVLLGECDAINRKSGDAVVVHLTLSGRVSADNVERVTQLIEKRQNTIRDRVQMILRSADPQHLNEPNLDTLKRQVKTEVDKILGEEELVLEVLIPQILQSRARL
ncbi:MAG: hypothetical protein GY842_20545 [bacterium]|nr:hypothetical protein [bacterium]